jgi:cytochrome c6
MVLATLMLGTGIYLMVRQGQTIGIQPYVWVKIMAVLASIPLGVMGSKRGSVALTGFAFLLLAGVMGLSYSKPAFLRRSSAPVIAGSPAVAGLDMAKVEAGQVLFEQQCTRCHGGDGTAGLQKAANLATSRMADSDIATILRQGKGVMPSNPDLTPEQIDQLKEYLHFLRK